jgi:serpin B
MLTTRRTIGPLIVTLLALSCTAAPEEEAKAPPPGERIGSELQRVLASAPPADVAAAARGQNDLGFELYRKLVEDGENLFFSPFSISTALSMTYAGAHGSTATAFEQVLGSGLQAAAHHRAMNDLDLQLSSRGQGASGADGNPFRLNTTNQLFAQAGYPFEAPFLDTLALEYGADVRLLDFEKQTEPSRTLINDWVASRTEQRILNLLGPGVIRPDTRLVLVNAIYFNAAWADAFGENATSPGDFRLEDGGHRSVPMMRNADLPTRAAQVDGVEVFELPYDGHELAMLVMMPPAGTLADFEATLSAARLEVLVGALSAEHLDLSFPRFEARTSAALSAPLKELGLEVAFSDLADFSAMSSAERLMITDVVHQAFVKVNEKGTEAAAATAVIIGPTSMPQVRRLEVDRPFVFAIRDNATGALVFLGRIAAP